MTFSCDSSFEGQDISLEVKVKSCNNPVKIGVTLKVDALDIHWSEDFYASKDIPIPGFSIPFAGGVYLGFKVTTKDDGDLNLKVILIL